MLNTVPARKTIFFSTKFITLDEIGKDYFRKLFNDHQFDFIVDENFFRKQQWHF